AVASWTVNIDTVVRAISGNWVPDPGVTIVGACGAGLSAGVLPSPFTYTLKRACLVDASLRMFLRHNSAPLPAATSVYQSCFPFVKVTCDQAGMRTPGDSGK